MLMIFSEKASGVIGKVVLVVACFLYKQNARINIKLNVINYKSIDNTLKRFWSTQLQDCLYVVTTRLRIAWIYMFNAKAQLFQ